LFKSKNALSVVLQSWLLLFQRGSFPFVLGCLVVFFTLTRRVFLAIRGEAGSHKNVQRDMKLAKNVTSLKYDLLVP